MKSKILPLTVLKRLTSGHDELIIDLINPEWSVSRWGSSIQCGHHKCHIHPQARNWHKVTRQQLMDGLKSKHYQQRLVFFWQCWRCVRRKWRRPDHRAWISLQVNFSFWVFLNKMFCFSYDDISIMFDNLGYGYNAVINGLSIFILKTQVNNSSNPKSDVLEEP